MASTSDFGMLMISSSAGSENGFVSRLSLLGTPRTKDQHYADNAHFAAVVKTVRMQDST